MLTILGSATSGLYLKLSEMVGELRDLGSQSRETDAPVEDEGLGAVYDTREWLKNYYGEHYEDDSFPLGLG
jgi:hypothetical protein